MKFTLEIELGNEAMSTGRELEQAINKVAMKVYQHNQYHPVRPVGEVAILDENGNTVGKWSVIDDSKAIDLPF